LKSQSSHYANCSPKSGRLGGQNPQRRKASTSWMSTAVMNLLHAVDAYVSLETTTARKTSCSPTSNSPRCLSTRRVYSVCAVSLTMRRMWSDADRLLLNVTPRILSELSRVMSGSGGGIIFNFLCLLSQKWTFLDFEMFSLRLFSASHATILSISAATVLTGGRDTHAYRQRI